MEDALNKCKRRCRTALDRNGIDDEVIDFMIERATSQKPKKKNPHLQRVYRSWQKVEDKRKEICDAEQPCDDFESERKHPER